MARVARAAVRGVPRLTDASCASSSEARRARRSLWRRASAMAHFIRQREKAVPVEIALERAADGVQIGAQQKPLTKEQLRRWLQLFVAYGGRIAASQQGAHAKTESFLSDEDLKAEARVWLRANCRAECGSC